MRKLLLIILLFCTRLGLAQFTYPAEETDNVFSGTNQFTKGITVGPITFSQLASISTATTMIYVTDATIGSNPCTGSGTGALAIRVNGSWSCAGNGGGGSGAIATKHLYVDGTRTDSYTANGSLQFPFKTVMGAVNQVITNADNATYVYVIDVAPAVYPETVDLGNSALVQLIFDGHGRSGSTGSSFNGYGSNGTDAAVLDPATGNSLQALSNDDNLAVLQIQGFQFNKPVNLTNPTASGHMGSGVIVFVNDYFFASTALTLNNIDNVGFDFSSTGNSTPINVTNVQDLIWLQSGMNGGNLTVTQNSGPAPAGWSGTVGIGIVGWGFGVSVVSLTGNVQIVVQQGGFGNTTTTVTLGTGQALSLANGVDCYCSIVVNSGGTLQNSGANIHNTLTVNSGGTYTPIGTAYVNNINIAGTCTGSGCGGAGGNPILENCTTDQTGNSFYNVVNLTQYFNATWQFVFNTTTYINCTVYIPTAKAGATLVLDIAANDATAGHTANFQTCDAVINTGTINPAGALTCAANQTFTTTSTAYNRVTLTFNVQSTLSNGSILLVKIGTSPTGTPPTANLLVYPHFVL